MKRRKLALIMMTAAVTINCTSPALNALAKELNDKYEIESSIDESDESADTDSSKLDEEEDLQEKEDGVVSEDYDFETKDELQGDSATDPEDSENNEDSDLDEVKDDDKKDDEIHKTEESEKNQSSDLEETEIKIPEEIIEDVTATEAKVNKFEIYNTEYIEAYDEEYKIDNSKIINISNNGGRYGSSTIDKAIDGNINTHWETGKPNSSNFTNEVVFNFEDIQEINRIIYKARGGNKGFAQEFEIHASQSEAADDFELISYGQSSVTSNLIEIKFDNTEFKRLKFVFKKANQDWAAAGEFMFYAQDPVGDKMENLFTDSSLSEVSDEFDSIEKIEELETEAINHPLYEIYKENIENAKLLLSGNGPIESKQAVVSNFDVINTEFISDYDEVYKIDNSNITSVTNNGGNYGGSILNRVIDGDLNTHWETGKPNNDFFNNEINFEFNSIQSINRIMYKSRGGNKGFANEFEIYGSKTTKGDTFELISFGTANTISNLIEIKFDETQFKRLKFVFKKANQDWAAASEFMFYSQDIISEKVNNLFTDKTQSKLKEEFNNINIINELEEEAKSHPLYAKLKQSLDMAKALLNNELDVNGKIIVAEQNGNMVKHANSNLLFGFGSNIQSTGLLAKPGQKIVIYVEADGAKPLPTVKFSQQEGSFANWERSVSLNAGRNEITVPEIPTDGYYHNPVTKGGAIYISNPYTAEEQGEAPILRFEGVERIPFLNAHTDVEEFKEFLIDYKRRVDEDKAQNPEMKDRQVIDTFEFASDHIIFTGTATGAYKAFIERGINPSDTITSYNKYMDVIFEYYGLDGSSEVNDPKSIRENVRLAQPFGYMYAAGSHIGVQGDVMESMLIPFEERGGVWGLTHEIGHRMDFNARLYGETTNNMLSQYISVYYGNTDQRIPYESHVYKNIIKENLKHYDEQGYFEKLAVFWQLEMYQNGYWAELNKLYRERKVQLDSNNISNSKMQYLVEFSSEVLNLDLSEFFARHGFVVNNDTRAKLSSLYNKPEGKLWYLNNSILGYEGEGFKEGSTIFLDIKADKVNASNTLIFNVDENSKNDVLGYEIIRDNEIIGFTSNTSFVDSSIDVSKNYTYEVVAYDKKLKTLDKSGIKGFTPILSSETEVTLKLYEEFNPLDYVDALSHTGEDLKNNIVIVSNNVDITKNGQYEIAYSVTDEEITVNKTVKFNVTSDYDYVSEMDIKSSVVGWRTLQRDRNPNGTEISLLRDRVVTNYAKGLGVHANSEVVYDIEGKGYESFESYIGIDQSMSGNPSSATFEIYVDGEKKFNSSVFKSDTNSQFVRVNVSGAKEVKLVTTDRNDGNNSDHTIWADAKFLITNSIPELNIPDSISTKVGQVIELNEEYSAFDKEDGDLTSKVEVTGNVNFNKTGEYTITYKVTDSDGNEVVKSRTIAVVDMNDYDYLTDYNWNSTINTYTAPLKDQSISNRTLRLTNEDGTIESYERGIGAHSTSTIIYNLNDKNYDYFSSFVGVDRQMYGTVGSVSFEVYVDGEKKFDSGVMGSRDPKKYVEVDINGAKELKLVVRDGNNGNGSDHATWGDTKLHYAREIEADYSILQEIVNNAQSIEKDLYTEESIEILEEVLLKAEKIINDKISTQEEVDALISEIQNAIDTLEENADLNEVIFIKDNALKNAIKEELNITHDSITIGDMHNLKSLTSNTGLITNIEGLQYAKNLESVNLEYNEITDISPLKHLKKLKDISIINQYIAVGQLNIENEKVSIDETIIGLDGQRLAPSEITLGNKTGSFTIDVNSSLDNEIISIDSSNLKNGANSVNVKYESLDGKYSVVRIYMTMK